MIRLAEPVAVPTGLLVFVGAVFATVITEHPAAAATALLVLPVWWRAHRQRETQILQIRERLAGDPVRVSQMEWEW